MKVVDCVSKRRESCKSIPSIVLHLNTYLRCVSSLLCYHGYLEIDVDVFHFDLTNLRDGNDVSDRMLDFLLL